MACAWRRFATYNSWEGLFYYLGAILTQTEDKEVHFKYIDGAPLPSIEEVPEEPAPEASA